MIDKKIFSYLLSTDGINQIQRSLVQLDPESIKLDGRSKSDILRFLLALSKEIRYYDTNNTPQGDWHNFLEKLIQNNNVLDDPAIDLLFKDNGDCPPHLALMLAFLEIFTYVQNDLNGLSMRRLNFYLEEVLRMNRRAAVADQVHVLFEITKNAKPVSLKKGELLDAKNTGSGLPLLYELDSEYVINHAHLAKQMTHIVDRNLSGRRIIYMTEDATQVKGSESGWRPFGEAQLTASAEMQNMQEASLGCAIASPNFHLAEGNRTITVVMHLKSDDPVPPQGYNLQNALDIRMTGELGWIAPNTIKSAKLLPQTSAGPLDATLTIEIEYKEASPSIVSYNEEKHQKRLRTSSPVWSMTTKPMSFVHDMLVGFKVSEVEVAVDVKGLSNLILQNDQAVQSVDSPVMPFGHSPNINSNFYIGSEEAFTKSITSLALNLNWQDVADNMDTHYAEYENPNINNSVFQADIYLLAGKSWNTKLTGAKQTLFNSLGNQLEKKMVIDSSVISSATAYSSYKRQSELSLGNAYSHSTTQGFIKLVLTGPTKQDVGFLPTYAPFEAFGHKSFSSIYAQHAIQIALEVPDVELPQTPFTPTLSAVSIDYTASDKFKPDIPNLIEQFFLLDVFGSVESDELSVVSLVPDQKQEGALYLGLEKAQPAQILSLLFHIEEGSTPGAVLLASENILWEYLAGGQWKEISKKDILEDKTEGFQIPGLVRLQLGPDATSEHSLMPEFMHWVRASISDYVDGAANVIKIHTQAARASLKIPSDGLDSDYDEHLATPLGSNIIQNLKSKIPAIKKVNQPYPSFGGKPHESSERYYQRAHERLRHRSRAVSAWDYERLLLEAFPVIFKVKCLPHTDEENNLVPGDVKLVVVPDWRKRPTGNPLQPKVNGAFLRTIKEFLETNYASEFTRLHVTNPVYETLLVDCKIAFNMGFDPGYYAGVLEEEIKIFLSPWSYDEGEDIVFGGKIHASEILAFIEGRDYVDYVTDFALYHQYKGKRPGGIGEMKINEGFVIGLAPQPSVGDSGKIIGEDFVVGVPVDVAATTRPDAILVSSGSHRIGVLSDEVCEGTQSIGIGNMVIGLDFIIVS